MALSGSQVTGVGPTHPQGAYAGFAAKAEDVAVIAFLAADISLEPVLAGESSLEPVLAGEVVMDG